MFKRVRSGGQFACDQLNQFIVRYRTCCHGTLRAAPNRPAVAFVCFPYKPRSALGAGNFSPNPANVLIGKLKRPVLLPQSVNLIEKFLIKDVRIRRLPGIARIVQNTSHHVFVPRWNTLAVGNAPRCYRLCDLCNGYTFYIKAIDFLNRFGLSGEAANQALLYTVSKGLLAILLRSLFHGFDHRSSNSRPFTRVKATPESLTTAFVMTGSNSRLFSWGS